MDSIFMDIDFYKDKQIFTIDKTKFSKNQIMKIKQKYNKKLVVIMDAAIGIKNDNIHRMINKYDAMIKDMDGKQFEGRVWAGMSLYPDLLHPNISQFYDSVIDQFYSDIEIDGLWLDMNEFTNFCNGRCDSNIVDPFVKNLIYIPGNRDLNTMTVAVSSRHWNGNL